MPVQTKAESLVSKLPFSDLMERLCKVDEVREVWRRAMNRTSGSIYRRVLDEMGIEAEYTGSLSGIPLSGPLLVVANHPFGMVEGPVLGSILEKVRDDFMFITNSMLAELPELAPKIIGVDPFGGAAHTNAAAVRRALQHLKNGGALVVFPAGEVSSMRPPFGRVEDPEWQTTAARLALKMKAPVLPVYFEGSNGVAFQIAGLIHPRLRTLMLPVELLSRRHHRVRIAIGHTIPSCRFQNADTMTKYLRNRVYALEPAVRRAPVMKPVPVSDLKSEIAGLIPIASTGAYDVYLQRAAQIPLALLEIGRLREVTFRAAGEGTGKPADLDRYDADYWHLFVWHRGNHEIAGAYRLADVAELPHWRNAYCSTLFYFPKSWNNRARHTVELGRSFVCEGYQRDYLPLLLLWRGIGSFVMARPHVRYLYGPVSISASYSHTSRSTIARELTTGWTGFLPRNPLSLALTLPLPGRRRAGDGVAVLDKRVELLEPDAKGLPVLLRQYLALGGEVLCWNLDRCFSNALDALVLLDLRRVPRRMLSRYLGPEAANRYLGCKATEHAGD